MSTENGTLNNAAKSSGGNSSPLRFKDYGDLVSTAEFDPAPIPDQPAADTDPGAANNTQDANVDTESGKAKEDSVKEDFERFDKHPRFQQLHKANNELRQQAQEYQDRLVTLEKQLKEQQTPKPDKPDTQNFFEDISGMDNEVLMDRFSNDPKGFLANYGRQIRHESKQEIKAEVMKEVLAKIESRDAKANAKTEQDRIAEDYEKYAEENPDFWDRWESGEISRFIAKNPAHNAISAHMALTQDNREKTAAEKAAKEAEAKALKAYQAKQGARTLGSGPPSGGHTPGAMPPELLNPKKYGGIEQVLAARSAARRRQP